MNMTVAEGDGIFKKVVAIHKEVGDLEVEFAHLRFYQISKVRANLRERTVLLDKAKVELDRYFGIDLDIETPPSAFTQRIGRFRLFRRKDNPI